MRLRLTIRDLLWLTTVAALAVALWLDHAQVRHEREKYEKARIGLESRNVEVAKWLRKEAAAQLATAEANRDKILESIKRLGPQRITGIPTALADEEIRALKGRIDELNGRIDELTR